MYLLKCSSFACNIVQGQPKMCTAELASKTFVLIELWLPMLSDVLSKLISTSLTHTSLGIAHLSGYCIALKKA